jgi:nucleotide-binding universal stress UspA family protein
MRILIATDGSEYSKAAVEQACRLLICPENAELLIVSAYEDSYPIMAEPYAISAEYYQKIDDAVAEMAATFVADAKKMVTDKFSAGEFPINTEILRGPPDQQILDKAKEWNADVIVVGSHGRGFWGRLLGSVSSGVVHHAPCSVLVVRS